MRKLLLIGLAIFLLSGTVSAKQAWYCNKWQITIYHHQEYTTYYPLWVGKVMIEEPIIHPYYEDHNWECTGYWQKTKPANNKVWVHKYE